MIRIEVTRQAACDRDRIIDFYGQGSARADQFILDVNRAFATLTRFPDSASKRPNITSEDLRFWLIEPHYLVFQRHSDYLLVIGMFHCSRNVSRELRYRLGKKSDD